MALDIGDNLMCSRGSFTFKQMKESFSGLRISPAYITAKNKMQKDYTNLPDRIIGRLITALEKSE